VRRWLCRSCALCGPAGRETCPACKAPVCACWHCSQAAAKLVELDQADDPCAPCMAFWWVERRRAAELRHCPTSSPAGQCEPGWTPDEDPHCTCVKGGPVGLWNPCATAENLCARGACE
jgi:hypothetical protein